MKQVVQGIVTKIAVGIILFCITGFTTWLTTIYLTQQKTSAEIIGIKVKQEERYTAVINRLNRIEDKIDGILK